MTAPEETPLSVSRDPTKGRCFVLNKNVKTGQILHVASPYAAVPDMGSLQSVCASCVHPPSHLNSCTRPNANETIHGSHVDHVSGLLLPSQRPPLPVSCFENKCSNIVYYDTPSCSERDWHDFHAFECTFLSDWKNGTIPVLSTLLPFHGKDSDSYTLDYTRMLIRTLIRAVQQFQSLNETPVPDVPVSLVPSAQSRPASSDYSSLTFADVWALCDNISGFDRQQLVSFGKSAIVLYVFVRDYLTKEFPNLNLLAPTFLPGSEEQYSSLIWSIYSHLRGETLRLNSHHLPVSAIESVFDLKDPKEDSTHPHWHVFSSLFTLICKEECNSFGLYTYAYEGNTVPRQGYGLALYPSAVYFNHACAPNVGHATRTRPITFSMSDASKTKKAENRSLPHMIFYAVEDILAGEEAYVSYVALDSDVHERRQDLKYYFMFDCGCPRCLDEMGTSPSKNWAKGAERCPKENVGCRGFMVPSTVSEMKEHGEISWTCEGCGVVRE